jgi:hypothetical protein
LFDYWGEATVAARRARHRVEICRPAINRRGERRVDLGSRKAVRHRSEERAGTLLFPAITIEEREHDIDQRMTARRLRQEPQELLRVGGASGAPQAFEPPRRGFTISLQLKATLRERERAIDQSLLIGAHDLIEQRIEIRERIGSARAGQAAAQKP